MPYLVAGENAEDSNALFQLVRRGTLRREVVQSAGGGVGLRVVGGVRVRFREILERQIPGRLKAGLIPFSKQRNISPVTLAVYKLSISIPRLTFL